MGHRRGRRTVPLAAFSLGLVVLMDFCNLSALYSYHREIKDRDSSSTTSSKGGLKKVQSRADRKRSLLRSSNGTSPTSSSSSSSSSEDPRHQEDAVYPRTQPEVEVDSNMISTPSPSPSVRMQPAPTGIPPRGESPYELRWPAYWLPSWSKKRYAEPLPNADVPPPTTICYVHVGKTAGSTIGCALGFKLHCRGDMWHPPNSLLFRYTTNSHHSDVNDCSLRHDYYLVTLRDPVERLLSWYEYEEDMLDRLRVECGFETLNDLAVLGLPRRYSGGQVSKACKRRARRAIAGEEQFGYHAYHNYGYHLRQVPSNATVAAIRSEHLVEDWNSMEELLGSEARVESFPRRNPADNSTKVSRFLSDLGRDHLCKWLCDEIQVYKSILDRAVNLGVEDVHTSMAELRRSCPREADAPSCPQ